MTTRCERLHKAVQTADIQNRVAELRDILEHAFGAVASEPWSKRFRAQWDRYLRLYPGSQWKAPPPEDHSRTTEHEAPP